MSEAAQRIEAPDHGDLPVQVDRRAITSGVAHLEHLHCNPSVPAGRFVVAVRGRYLIGPSAR